MLNNIIDRIKLPFRKDKELYFALYRLLGFYPHDISFYKTALLHKSVKHRNTKGKPVNNERLEFLGDAVLDCVVGDIVFRHFPGKREGFLTNTRSKLVQRETLNRLADEMGINKMLLSNRQVNTHNSNLGGNAFEALVGAIYLDRGYNACMKFMEQRILAKMINIDKVAYKEVNFKSKLIEWTQKNKVTIEFEEVAVKSGENGSPIFTYKTVLEGIDGATSTGYSKKESQQLASKLTLELLRKKPQFIQAVFDAKTQRTKMEEEPIESVPDTKPSTDFIISSQEPAEVAEKHPNAFTAEVYDTVPEHQTAEVPADETLGEGQPAEETPAEETSAESTSAGQSKEDIIAAAEAAAFAEA